MENHVAFREDAGRFCNPQAVLGVMVHSSLPSVSSGLFGREPPSLLALCCSVEASESQ